MRFLLAVLPAAACATAMFLCLRMMRQSDMPNHESAERAELDTLRQELADLRVELAQGPISPARPAQRWRATASPPWPFQHAIRRTTAALACACRSGERDESSRWVGRRDAGRPRSPGPATGGCSLGPERRSELRRARRPGSSHPAYRVRRTLGWALVGLAIVVGVSHWLTHLGAWDFASQGIEDLVTGYPMAALLGIGGAIVLSR